MIAAIGLFLPESIFLIENQVHKVTEIKLPRSKKSQRSKSSTDEDKTDRKPVANI